MMKSGILYQRQLTNRKIQLPESAVLLMGGRESKVNVMTLNMDEGISIYSESTWEKVQEKLSSHSSKSIGFRKMQRTMIGHATEIVIRDDGIIDVPESMREYLGPEEYDLFLLSSEQKIEIWNVEKFLKHVSYSFERNEYKILFRNNIAMTSIPFYDVLHPKINLV